MENKESVPAPIQEDALITQSKEVTTPPEKSKHSKLIKILLIVLGIIGVLLIFVAPILLEIINPEQRYKEATQKACVNECSQSSDKECVNKCLEESGLSDMINKAKISPTPIITVTPASTLAPTAAKKIIYAPKNSPTPAGNPTLVIKAGKGVTNVTIFNQSTGKSFSEDISSPGKNYYIEPGSYKITFNEIPNCRASHSICYENCSMNSGNWGWDINGSTADLNIEVGKTHAASLYYTDPSSTTNPGIVCKSL